MSRTKTRNESLDEFTQEDELMSAEKKFQKACVQIHLLNKQLGEMKVRYCRAKEDNFKCFRYNLRLKLAVIEGVRNMYYDYTHIQAEVVAKLREQMFGEIVEIVSSDHE